MKTPNRVGFQLQQELCDILNEGNRMIEACGCETPGHILEVADWDDDGYCGVQMFTTEEAYEKMQPALEKMYAKLRKHNYLGEKEPTHFTHDKGLTFCFYLQRVNITVRDKKGAKSRVLTYEEYGRRLYAAKPNDKDEVLRIYIWDHQLGTPLIKERYEWLIPMQYDRQTIQDILDKKMGQGKYLCVEITHYPRDRRKKPTTQHCVYEREGMKIIFSPAFGHHELLCKEGMPSISPEECERLKGIGVRYENGKLKG